MLTPDDIRSSKRTSGFLYVTSNAGSAIRPFQARAGWKMVNGSGIPDWVGPRRATALEAAQDYCDYANGNTIPVLAVLKTAGHIYSNPSNERDPEVEAALGVLRDAKAEREGKQGYVYLMIEDKPGGGFSEVKIGYSTNPEKRVAELQTGNFRKLKLLYKKPATRQEERRLHRKYAQQNILQEWFKVTRDLLLEFDAEHAVHPNKEVGS